MEKPTFKEIAAKFGVPLDNVIALHKKNIEGLKQMFERSIKTGKYNGYTTSQLREMIAESESRLITEV